MVEGLVAVHLAIVEDLGLLERGGRCISFIVKLIHFLIERLVPEC